MVKKSESLARKISKRNNSKPSKVIEGRYGLKNVPEKLNKFDSKNTNKQSVNSMLPGFSYGNSIKSSSDS